jgi:hypothetical protein
MDGGVFLDMAMGLSQSTNGHRRYMISTSLKAIWVYGAKELKRKKIFKRVSGNK